MRALEPVATGRLWFKCMIQYIGAEREIDTMYRAIARPGGRSQKAGIAITGKNINRNIRIIALTFTNPETTDS
jgi:hypothetical protein